MQRHSLFGLAFLCLFLAHPVRAANVEIDRAEFRIVEAPGSNSRWYEIVVTLEVDRGSGSERSHSRYASGVVVEIAVGVESESNGRRGLEVYRSEVELVALEVGRHPIRFYLPPELVARDRIRGEPFAYELATRLGRDGEPRVMRSRSLQAPAAVQEFQSKLALGRGTNDGILLPQHQTPFWLAYPGDTSSVRRSASSF